jgi:glycylpeptide N-tetradecanoyltransferase
MSNVNVSSSSSSSQHRFWGTQPVSKYTGGGGGEAVSTDAPLTGDYTGPLRHQTVEDTKKEPYALPAGFEWSTLDLSSTTSPDLEEVYNLLARNYVEDDDCMFRFDYKREFLVWAVTAPGFTRDLHLGVRVQATGKLMGLITAIPQGMVVHGVKTACVEINFLCVHKKLRSKRLAPVLIKEITRRVNLTGIFQAVYTAGVEIPGSIGEARYYHRSINPKKLIECNFTRLNNRLTMAQTCKYYKTVTEVKTGLREMTLNDVEGAHELLMSYLAK